MSLAALPRRRQPFSVAVGAKRYHFQETTDLDPGYALAHVGMVDNYNLLSSSMPVAERPMLRSPMRSCTTTGISPALRRAPVARAKRPPHLSDLPERDGRDGAVGYVHAGFFRVRSERLLHELTLVMTKSIAAGAA